MQGKWVEEIGVRMPRIEVAGDICLRRPRHIQGCRADDDEKHTFQNQKTNTSLFKTLTRDAKFPNTRSPGQLHFV
jgi:hypothetical protein